MIMTEDEQAEIIDRLRYAVSVIAGSVNAGLVPVFGMNIGYARESARTPSDVAGVRGGIVALDGRPHPVGEIAFGATDYIAGIVLTAMRFDRSVRSAANFRYSPGIVPILEDLFLDVCSFDRRNEPPGISTINWGVASCCKNGVPEVIFDTGAADKEPMVRILDQEPIEVAKKILKVSMRIVDDQSKGRFQWV